MEFKGQQTQAVCFDYDNNTFLWYCCLLYKCERRGNGRAEGPHPILQGSFG